MLSSPALAGGYETYKASVAQLEALQAKADFSICNEEMCKLYRATPVEWTTQIKTP